MIFNELTYYLLFLFPSVAVFHVLGATHLRRRKVLQSWTLATFGMLFFVWFAHKHFGGRVGILAIAIFIWELAFSRLYRPGSRACLLGILQAILLLVALKYSLFLSHVVVDTTGIRMGLPQFIVPLGLSFFTFEFIHFAADSYVGAIAPVPLSRYAAFIFFFPTMVAGPIKRFQEFNHELDSARFQPELMARGMTRILTGLAKKHVLADTFMMWSDRLNTLEALTAKPAELLMWLLAYAMQIYFDFSGYSDIAIGSGYLFGIHVPENFNWPYLSRSISDFWRRWHISLGRWIFDYVYKPLGGSRRGKVRTLVNLFLAFLVSGLWHGAAYNFLVWGAWHGAMMIVHRLWKQWQGRPQGRAATVVGTALTFIGVVVGWGFFSMNLRRACFVLGRISGLL